MIHVLLCVIVTAQFLLPMWFVSFQLQWLLVSQIFLLLLDLFNDSGVTGGANTGTHTTNKTQLLEIVRLPVAARKELRTVY